MEIRYWLGKLLKRSHRDDWSVSGWRKNEITPVASSPEKAVVPLLWRLPSAPLVSCNAVPAGLDEAAHDVVKSLGRVLLGQPLSVSPPTGYYPMLSRKSAEVATVAR